MTLHTKSIDVECPTCKALCGRYCETGGRPGYHRERVKAAAAQTRGANQEARR